MSITPHPRRHPARFFVIALVLTCGFVVGSRAQMLDLNHNGMSDVWEQIFNASSLSPNADTDNDGIPNRQEALAGTNPTNAFSVPKIPSYTRTATNFSVTIPVALGKQYQL